MYSKGFSLIEIMIVLVIISIISALAVPGYKKIVMKAKQTEAKNILTAIHASQKLYFLEHNEYSDSITDLDVEIDNTSGNNLYTYEIVGVDFNTEYTARASANLDDDTFLDTWQINQDNMLRHTANDYDDYTE